MTAFTTNPNKAGMIADDFVIREWMKDALRLGDFFDDCLEVDCTNLAEAACGEFNLFGPEPAFEAPDFLFDMAVEVAAWWGETD